MKVEALQSLSVIVMVVGLFLSALGGLGAYFFSSGGERSRQPPSITQMESAEPELSMRDSNIDSKFASLTEPAPEVTAKQLSLIPEPALPVPPTPIPVKSPPAPAIVAKKEEAAPKPAPAHPAPAPAPVVPEPVKVAATAPAHPTPAPAPVPPEPAKVAATAPAKPPVPEKRPAPETPAARTAGLGIEPFQKEKLLQRLRTFQNGSIAIQVPEGNTEAMDFAIALKEAFLSAGWHVTSLAAVKTDRDSHGLTLSSGTFPPPTEVTTIFSALVSAGIKLGTDLDPSQGKQHAILFIGSRP